MEGRRMVDESFLATHPAKRWGMGDVNIGGAAKLASSLEEMEEWKYRTQFFDCRGLQLDLNEEIETAAAAINALP